MRYNLFNFTNVQWATAIDHVAAAGNWDKIPDRAEKLVNKMNDMTFHERRLFVRKLAHISKVLKTLNTLYN